MLIGANMADGPESSAFLEQTGLLSHDVLPEELQVIALTQEVRARLGLDKLSVEVDRVLDGLVLHGEDLDPLHHLVQEELRQDVGRWPTGALLARETEVDAVFHHEEALLPLRALQSFQELSVDLGHSPRFEIARPALLVDELVSKFGADRDVGVAKLFKAHFVDFAVVFD